MENVLQLTKITDEMANPCTCRSEDLMFALHQTEKGKFWAICCNNCDFVLDFECKTEEEILSLWNQKMKSKKAMNGSAATRAKQKYNAKAYERIPLDVPKGYKDTIKEHVKTTSESVNGFIKRAIQETMERDKERGI